MTRRKASDMEEDEDYDPYDSFDEGRRVRQRGESGSGGVVVRSSRGRPVKARQYTEDSESDDEDQEEFSQRRPQQRPRTHPRQPPGQQDFAHMFDDDYSRPAPQPRVKSANRRQRWVPHNPLIVGGYEDDDDSKDPQISDDDDESGDEGASRASRRKAADNRLKGGSVPVRDETGKFIGVRPQTAAERRQATNTGIRGPGGGGIFKTAAVTVLREERRLMSTGEIARIALKRGYIKVQGRTPEATMASAMYTDVKRKEDRSTFIRPHEGLFGLREWLDEGVNFKVPDWDPIEDKFPDESTQAVLRRNRISSTQQLARANSRGSNAGHRGRSHAGSPAYDPFLPSPSQSHANSHRTDPIFDKDEFPPDLPELGSKGNDDISIGLPPRLASGLAGLEPKVASALGGGRGFQPTSSASTPFGSNRGGPSPEIFKSRFAEGAGRSGFAPVAKRSMSGGQLPGFQAPQRANSAGRKQRKPGPNMTQQDSGNMMLLLNAVEDVKSMERPSSEARRQGYAPRPSGLDRRQTGSGFLKREIGDVERQPQLTVLGFNAGRIATVQNMGASNANPAQADQVNILNLPLPEADTEEGTMSEAEVPPQGVEVDPSLPGNPPVAAAAPTANSTPPPGVEAALQALDSAFASAPLPMTGSLSGPLAPAIRVPSEALLPIPATAPQAAPLAEVLHHLPGASNVAASGSPTPTPAAPAAAHAPAPAAGRDVLQPVAHPSPQMAFAAQQGPGSGAMPDFGPPEEGAKQLPEVEAAVRGMETSLGERHPKVGKGYLYLSRVYQCMATPEYYQKAQQALHHAYEICFACQKPPQ